MGIFKVDGQYQARELEDCNKKYSRMMMVHKAITMVIFQSKFSLELRRLSGSVLNYEKDFSEFGTISMLSRYQLYKNLIINVIINPFICEIHTKIRIDSAIRVIYSRHNHLVKIYNFNNFNNFNGFECSQFLIPKRQDIFQPLEFYKNISPETLAAEAVAERAQCFEEITKTKTKRKKCVLRNDQGTNLFQQTNDKVNALYLGIMAYMYQFGVRGCLRSDVIERSKYQWFDIIQKTHMLSPEQLSNNTKSMKNCFDRLEDKSKKLDYFLRQLKTRVKDKYVVQFLLDRQFFIHDTSDSIYKNQKTNPQN